MAAPSLLVRQGIALGVRVSVVTLVDRRQDTPGEPQNWVFQRDIESVLYGNGYCQKTGAVYRLLRRSGVGPSSLPLKKACIQQGLVTEDEFNWLQEHLVDVRSFTLIPLEALNTALSAFGCNERSEALVAALGVDRPDDWPAAEEEEEEEVEEEVDEEEEEEEEEEEKEGSGGDADGDENGGNGDGNRGDGGGNDGDGHEGDERSNDDSGGSDDASVAGTEVVDEPPVIDTEEDSAPIARSAKRGKHLELSPIAIMPKLEAELIAFDAFRAALINQNRVGGASAATTRSTNRSYILRFFAWLTNNGLMKCQVRSPGQRCNEGGGGLLCQVYRWSIVLIRS